MQQTRKLSRLVAAFLLFGLTAMLMGADMAHADATDAAQKLWLAGQRKEAVARVEEALAKTPDDLKLRFSLGVMRMELGDHAAAQILFTALTQDFPDLADPYNNLAVIHASLGKLDQARSELEQALLLQPDHAQAQENLGDVLVRLAHRAYQRAQAALVAPSEALALKLRRTADVLRTTGPGR